MQEFYRCNIWHIRGRQRDMPVSERPLTAVASDPHFDHLRCHHAFPDRCVRQAGADPYVTDAIFEALPPTAYQSTTYAVKAAPAPRMLDDGDVIHPGDRHFETIHTPAHSPGGIALYEAAPQTLFSGDILYDGLLIEDTYHANADDYIRSMKRLLSLDLRCVHGGHFPSFDGARLRCIVKDWLDGKA